MIILLSRLGGSSDPVQQRRIDRAILLVVAFGEGALDIAEFDAGGGKSAFLVASCDDLVLKGAVRIDRSNDCNSGVNGEPAEGPGPVGHNVGAERLVKPTRRLQWLEDLPG